VEDKSLSTYAHNVKIISQNGMVTLKGPVRSEEEKAAVESKAAEIAGKDKVTSQLEVKRNQ
jgi:hyperosmotically inducible periplasmic protein